MIDFSILSVCLLIYRFKAFIDDRSLENWMLLILTLKNCDAIEIILNLIKTKPKNMKNIPTISTQLQLGPWN